MKKFLALFSAALLFGASAFAEGYINANDLTLGEITEDKTEEDGFVIHASAERMVVIDKADGQKYEDEVFTQRINLKGKIVGKARCVSFPAKAGEKITVYCLSSSKTDARVVVVRNEAGETLKEISAAAANPVVSVGEIVAPADGEYTVGGTNGGVYIYQITVGK